MRPYENGWSKLLRDEGPQFLNWIQTNQLLEKKFDELAAALSTTLAIWVNTPEAVQDIWRATPAVLSRCNEQETYSMPGAAQAYAWLHLLDRYARTWRALEILVAECCLPMGKHGVRALDVGTGPGPAAFAMHDFYVAMMEFATQASKEKWCQPPFLECVEFNPSTNCLRYHLAQTHFEQTECQHKGILALCRDIPDFSAMFPTLDRKYLQESLRWQEDIDRDEENNWDSTLRYTPDEANTISQSAYRYRLIIFSNFLTEVRTVMSFEHNLTDILQDARPGSVSLVLGGKGGMYPDVYGYFKSLAEPAGFHLKVQGVEVSSASTPVADRVYEEGLKFFRHLQSLAPEAAAATTDPNAQRVVGHFTTDRQPAPTSQLWAFRKYDSRVRKPDPRSTRARKG